MELFKYRRVALGCALFLVFLPLSFYLSFSWRISILISSCLVTAGSALLHIILKNKKSLSAMLRLVPASLFVALAMVVSLISFNSDNLTKYMDGNEHCAKMKITEISYCSAGFGIYKASLFEIDGEEINHNIELRCNGQALSRGDIVLASGDLKKISSPTVGFDSGSYSLGEGIVATMKAKSFSIVDKEPMLFSDLLHGANSFLSARFEKIGDSSTYSLLSALFLGNKGNLGLDLRRDFTRIGLNHVLALSGMHITIVVTIIGISLAGAPLGKSLKELILILSTVFFVGMTGFSLSAVRAGFMVCIVYTLKFFGARISTVSSLFLSVTLICVTSPYSIFSLSLILSFFAMLGCLVSSKIIRRYRLYRVFKRKLVRFAAFSFISTTFALLFTLPITSFFFGSFSILSLISNIIIAPIFSLLIYLCPLYLLFADVPFLSTAIGSICIWITKLATFLASTLSSIDGALIPIMGNAQYISTAIIAFLLFLLLTVKRKYLLRMILCVGVGTLAFAISTLALFIERWNNVYVGAYSEDGDIAFIEDKGEITIIDMTDATRSKYVLGAAVSEYLGYFEVDNYVLTNYSVNSLQSFNNLSDSIIIYNLFLPLPRNGEESEIAGQLRHLAESKGIAVVENSGVITTKSTTVAFAPTDYLPRSVKRCTSFRVDCVSTCISYFGKSAFELCEPFISEAAYSSDVAIFGDYGPNCKINYSYQMPYVDYAIFFGDTISYADTEFLSKLSHKATEYHGTPIRFSVTP